MILIDTSAWVEFLRDTGTPVCDEVDRLLAEDVVICDAVRMEVLAGARDDAHLRRLRGLLARATTLPTEPGDYETAASLYRSCRRSGETVRKLIDCLIGAVALRHGAAVLHADSDYATLARHTALVTHEPAG
jgi:predicted nucleic acid-binding protein